MQLRYQKSEKGHPGKDKFNIEYKTSDSLFSLMYVFLCFLLSGHMEKQLGVSRVPPLSKDD
jgi:hypothetical protein